MFISKVLFGFFKLINLRDWACWTIYLFIFVWIKKFDVTKLVVPIYRKKSSKTFWNWFKMTDMSLVSDEISNPNMGMVCVSFSFGCRKAQAVSKLNCLFQFVWFLFFFFVFFVLVHLLFFFVLRNASLPLLGLDLNYWFAHDGMYCKI